MTDFTGPLATFDHALSTAITPDAPFDALLKLTQETIGVKLFTFMTADMKTELAQRSYTSHPEDYPVSGTKPITYDRWFETVHKDRKSFVANTLAVTCQSSLTVSTEGATSIVSVARSRSQAMRVWYLTTTL